MLKRRSLGVACPVPHRWPDSVVAELNEADRRWLDALRRRGQRRDCRSLGEKPFEYLLLGVEPAAWAAGGFRPGATGDVHRPQGKDLPARVGAGRRPRCPARPAGRIPRARRARPTGTPLLEGRPDHRAARSGARGLRPEDASRRTCSATCHPTRLLWRIWRSSSRPATTGLSPADGRQTAARSSPTTCT